MSMLNKNFKSMMKSKEQFDDENNNQISTKK